MTKTCRRCGVTYEGSVAGVMFGERTDYDRRTCRPCRQTLRDATKSDRFRQKAMNAIATHARKYQMRPADFRDAFGWVTETLVADLRQAWRSRCTACNMKFKDMGGGLGEMTFDVMDPTRDPVYATNVDIICNTCNRQKQGLTQEQYADVLRGYDQWQARRDGVGTLFEGIS